MEYPKTNLESRYDDALKLLNKWANLLIQIESDLNIRRSEVSNLDYDFLYTLGQSIYYINLYNAQLIKRLRQSKNKSKEMNEIADYIRYFNGLTTSKIKHFFFRELPIINVNNNDVNYNWDIYLNAKQILDSTDNNIKIETTKKHVYMYALNLSMVYSVLYNSITNKGLFLHFQKDNSAAFADFTKLKEIILNILKDVDSSEKIHEFANNFYIEYFSYYLKKDGKSVDSNLPLSKVYADFYDSFNSSDEILLERFTYRLGEIVWKFDGMIQDDYEFTDREAEKSRDASLALSLKQHINDYFTALNSFNKYSNPQYIELFDIESRFIHTSYDLLLRQKSREEVFKKFDEMRIKSLEFSTYQEAKPEDLNIDRIVNLCRSRGETGYRIETMLSILPKEDLLGLIGLFVQFVNRPTLHKKETQLVGMYKSGVFLAHLVNIFFNLEKPIWLFKTKPYVATHPVHTEKFSHGDGYNNIMVFDDVLKTGFTFFMYENYLSRNLDRVNLSLTLFTLSRFEYYKTITSSYKFDSGSLLSLNSELIPSNYDVLKILKSGMSYGFRLPEAKNGFIADVIKLLVTDGRYDLTYIMSDSMILFAICGQFVDIIGNQFAEYNNFSLYSPSPDGEILSMVVGLLLRLADKNVYFVKDTVPERTAAIYIDSYLFSTTLERHLTPEPRDGKCGFELFDLVVTIIMSKQIKGRKKFVSLHEAIE